jgi:hypothetical protein
MFGNHLHPQNRPFEGMFLLYAPLPYHFTSVNQGDLIDDQDASV